MAVPGSGIDSLLVRVQVNTQGVNFSQEIHKVLEAPPQSVTLHAAIRSNFLRVASFNSASRPGRFSRPLAPEIPSSLYTLTTFQPLYSATAFSSLA